MADREYEHESDAESDDHVEERYEWMLEHAASLPLAQLKIPQLLYCAEGIRSLRGKRKAFVIESIVKALEGGSLTTPLVFSIIRRLYEFPAIQMYTDHQIVEGYREERDRSFRRFAEEEAAIDCRRVAQRSSGASHNHAAASSEQEEPAWLRHAKAAASRNPSCTEAKLLNLGMFEELKQDYGFNQSMAADDMYVADSIRRLMSTGRPRGSGGAASDTSELDEEPQYGQALAGGGPVPQALRANLPTASPHKRFTTCADLTTSGGRDVPDRFSIPAAPRPAMSAVLAAIPSAAESVAAGTGAAGATAITGNHLRKAVRACIPSNRAVLRFALGPVRVPTRFSCTVPQASPSFDEYGRCSKHLLVVTTLDPRTRQGLSRSPVGARIWLDNKPTRIPGPSCCAWDVSRITIKGQRAPPASVIIEHSGDTAMVVCAVVEVVSALDLSAPVYCLKNSLARPAAAVTAIGRNCAGTSAASTKTRLSASLEACSAAVSKGDQDPMSLMWPAGDASSASSSSSSSSASSAAARPSPAQAAAGDDDDAALMETASVVKLVDPIRRKPITLPVRGAHCEHIDVMDAKSFEALPASKANPGTMRRCPYCRKDLSYTSLRVDTALAAMMMAVNGGQLSGRIIDTVAAAYGAKPEELISLQLVPALNLKPVEARTPEMRQPPAWLNAQEGAAVKYTTVSAIQVSPDGSWLALGASGKPFASIEEAAAQAKTDEEEDYDDDRQVSEALAAVAGAKRGRSAAGAEGFVSKRAPAAAADDSVIISDSGLRILRNGDGEDVIDLT
jgi:hypothetical protein